MSKPKHQDCCYVGVDPGKSGGIAIVGWSNGSPFADATMMSDNLEGILATIKSSFIREWVVPQACIEQMWMRPNQGSYVGKLMRNYGQLEMALYALDIPTEHVSPQRWQAALSISSRKSKRQRIKDEKTGKILIIKKENHSQFKRRLSDRAAKEFPEIRAATKRIGDFNKICDALLIALYCQRKHEGTLDK